MSDNEKHLERLRRATRVIHSLQQRLAEAERAASEPIAIVGLSCRAPGGVENADDFWQLLLHGRDAVGPVPSERWDQQRFYDPDPEAPGKLYVRHMGALAKVDEFDPELFGLSGREAESMDPQQRVLLEQCWHALEHANISPLSLMGSRTGVFVGTGASDFAARLYQDGPGVIDAYSATGSSTCIAAGRISYLFGLEGPCMVVDTACSSSLLAVHLACQSLQHGESELALAGGVNLLFTVEPTIMMCRARALSASGACRSFDDRADGYVRAEGCGMVVLKRLSDASRAGDRVLALVRGSASGHDGRSNGLTAPNGAAQATIIRAALARAGVEPRAVDLIEGHGSGTPLGDPIELEAIQEVFGPARGARPLWVSSVKANLGHLEAAAGVAGLIKTVLALRHGVVPPQPHFETPNRNFDWARGCVRVPTGAIALASEGKPLIAGVSSFGFSGANVHLVLEQVPVSAAAAQPDAARSSPELLPVSGKSPEAVRAFAGALARRLASSPDDSLADVARTLWHGRAQLEQRAAIVGQDREHAIAELRAFSSLDASAPKVALARAGSAPKVAFLCTGQGSQYAGMGRELFETYPAFRDTLSRCDELLRADLGGSLLAALYGGESAPAGALSDTALTQPALFALQMALAALWRSLGIVPSAVLGHSSGELAAACIAGVFELEAGVRIAAARGRLMAEHCRPGGMIAVACSEAAGAELVRAYASELAVAALNADDEIIVSGERTALAALHHEAVQRGYKTKQLEVSHAFHSPLMEPALAPLRELLEHVELRPPALAMISTLTGELAGAELASVAYWLRQAREPVRFACAFRALRRRPDAILLELGPQPHLLGLAAKLDESARGLPSLRRAKDERSVFLRALGELWMAGASVQGRALGRPDRHVDLPLYPFQRRRCWPRAREAELAVSSLAPRRIECASSQALYEQRHSADSYIRDHRIWGSILVPGAAQLVSAEHAARELLGADAALRDVSFEAPWPLEPGQDDVAQLVFEPDHGAGAHGREFAMHRRQAADQRGELRWQQHVSGRALCDAEVRLAPVFAPPTERASLDGAALYDQLARRGMQFGGLFQCLKQLWAQPDVVVAELELSHELAASASAARLHPVLVDGGFQAVAVLGALSEAPDAIYLPLAVGRFATSAQAGARVWVKVQKSGQPAAGMIRVDLAWYDEHGHPVAQLRELSLRRARPQELARALPVDPLLRRRDWVQDSAPPAEVRSDARLRMCVCGSGHHAQQLVRALCARGVAARREPAAQAQVAIDTTDVLVYLADPDADDLPSLERAFDTLQDAVRVHPGARLAIVTFEAQGVRGAEPVRPYQAALGGLARTLAWERAEQGCTHIDAPRDDGWPEQVAQELLTDTDEDTVAYRGVTRYLARLRPLTPPDLRLAVPEADNYVLSKGQDGLLESLVLEGAARRAPAAGEIEVEVAASGLNFRDVLNALGMLGTRAGPLGWECAGTVARVGEGVAHLAAGDRVFGIAPQAYARFVSVDARWFVRTPDDLSDVAAASLPLAFVTALYGLEQLGDLRPGQSVLIHAAAGGVGMAAVQVARALGAEVFATASPWKWPALEALGVSAPLNSRDTAFAEQILERTAGRGVDVVLNALTGAALQKSLSVLARGGRFLELGKLEVLSGDEPVLRERELRYRAFDLSELGPAGVQSLLERVLAGLALGVFKPLPIQSYPLGAARDAFRYVAQGQHVGKVVLVAPHRHERGCQVRNDGTYLITGASGGLGRIFANWLAERGAGALLLVSRQLPEPADPWLEALRARGVQVVTHAVDVADRGALAHALELARAELPPLRGVLHAAGALADGLFETLAAGDRARVFAPKIAGSENLDELTRRDPLDWFVLCSSTASVIGSAGQANYAAANAFMDALAHARRRRGLPACSINWGPWAEVGMAARTGAATRERWRQYGFEWLSAEQGRAAFERALAADLPQLTVLALDLARMHTALGTLPPLFAEQRQLAAKAAPPAVAHWRDGLVALPRARRKSWLLEQLLALIRQTLALRSEVQLSPDQSLEALGLDSLLAIELRNAIKRATGTTLSPTLLFDYPTLDALAGYLLQTMLPEQPPAAAVPERNDLLHVSDDEVDALMREELAAVRELLGQELS